MRRSTLATSHLYLLLACLLAPRTAPAQDESRAALQEAEWRAALPGLSARVRIDEESLGALDRALPSFDPDALEARSHTQEVNDMPDERGNVVRHALRALAYHRRIGALLERGPAICLLLGSRDESDWGRALMELCREPFGPRLGEVAERLSTDGRGPMRVMAGRIVNYLNAFCGGRSSAWGAKLRTDWDPTPLVRRIAKRLLEDRNPGVACSFATFDAYALEDAEVVDRMVEHLSDSRQTPRVLRGLLRTVEQTVGEACLHSLDAQFRFYRQDDAWFPAAPRAPQSRRVSTLPADGTADAVARWWAESRAAWSFPPDGPGWEEVLDRMIVVRRGEVARIETLRGELHVTFSGYAEHLDDGVPELSIHVEVDDSAENIHLDLGNPSHHLGYAGGSTATGGIGWITGSLMYAPATDRGVRMRVRLHVAASR